MKGGVYRMLTNVGSMRWLLSSRAFRRIVASRYCAFSGRKEFVYKEKALGDAWNAFTTSASGRVSLYRLTNSGFSSSVMKKRSARCYI